MVGGHAGMRRMCGMAAPHMVYSAVIKNESDKEVDIMVHYFGVDRGFDETKTLAPGASVTFEERDVQIKTATFATEVQHINIKSKDGAATATINAPFGVDGPTKAWGFAIQSDGAGLSVTETGAAIPE